MDQENIGKAPHKYFEMDSTPAGLTNYKKGALFTPAKEPANHGASMDTEYKQQSPDAQLDGSPN